MYSASSVDLCNALIVPVPCEQKVFSNRLKAASVSFGLQTGSGKLFHVDGQAMAKARGHMCSVVVHAVDFAQPN